MFCHRYWGELFCLDVAAFAEIEFHELLILSIYRSIWAERWQSKKLRWCLIQMFQPKLVQRRIGIHCRIFWHDWSCRVCPSSRIVRTYLSPPLHVTISPKFPQVFLPRLLKRCCTGKYEVFLMGASVGFDAFEGKNKQNWIFRCRAAKCHEYISV